MANLKEIRNRIASVKNTRKITSAMSRIASARLRKAQNTMESARSYGERMASVVDEVIGELDDPGAAHEFLSPTDQNELTKVALVVVTADRGLCGGFNSNVNRAAGQFFKEHAEQGHKVSIVAVGKKSLGYLKQLEIGVDRVHPAPEVDSVVPLAKRVSNEVKDMFAASPGEGGGDGAEAGDGDSPEADAEEAASVALEDADEVYLVYNHFKNVITQEVRLVRLLPFEAVGNAGDDEGDEPAEGESTASEDDAKKGVAVRKFEPGQQDLLDHLLPISLETTLQQAFVNSAAAEIAARRAAMDSATDNAGELIGELTLQFNRERQAAITKELMEIVGGAEALKG
jgi:F-type H+-transporting ATPase subunit gamma